MSIIGKTAKGFGRVIAAPAKFIYPKSAQNTGKNLFTYQEVVNSIYCPSCGESYLKLLYDDNVPTRIRDNAYSDGEIQDFHTTVYWACPECEFCYAASTKNCSAKKSIEQVRDFVRHTDKADFVNESLLTEAHISGVIDNQMRSAYIFYALAVASLLLIFFGIYKGAWFFCISMTLFVATFVMLGLKWSYRAWQLHTNNLYAADPKAQFLEWLSNNNPLKRPV